MVIGIGFFLSTPHGTLGTKGGVAMKEKKDTIYLSTPHGTLGTPLGEGRQPSSQRAAFNSTRYIRNFWMPNEFVLIFHVAFNSTRYIRNSEATQELLNLREGIVSFNSTRYIRNLRLPFLQKRIEEKNFQLHTVH